MPIYNKLVRDRIPEIIEKTGKTCTTRILNEKEYIGVPPHAHQASNLKCPQNENFIILQ